MLVSCSISMQRSALTRVVHERSPLHLAKLRSLFNVEENNSLTAWGSAYTAKQTSPRLSRTRPPSWNQNVHRSVNNLALNQTLWRMNPVHTSNKNSLRSIFVLCPNFPSHIIHLEIPTNILYALVTSPAQPNTSCLLHVLHLTLIILNEENKLCSSSLCSFLLPPTTSTLSGPNTLFGKITAYIYNLQ
jgi:hypothetical protein